MLQINKKLIESIGRKKKKEKKNKQNIKYPQVNGYSQATPLNNCAE